MAISQYERQSIQCWVAAAKDKLRTKYDGCKSTAVAVIVAFILGMLVSKGNQRGNDKSSVVGVYTTDS